MRALLIGQERANVAAIFNVSERTLSRWVAGFNESGIDGLTDEPRSGRPRALDPEKNDFYKELVKNPESADHAHWTAKKLHGYLTAELQEEVGYRTVVRWLHEQGFALRVPRPWPDRQDQAKRQQYLVKLAEWLKNDDIELWYSDESGFEGDPRPRRRWVEVGSEPTRVKNGTTCGSTLSAPSRQEQGNFLDLRSRVATRMYFRPFWTRHRRT